MANLSLTSKAVLILTCCVLSSSAETDGITKPTVERSACYTVLFPLLTISDARECVHLFEMSVEVDNNQPSSEFLNDVGLAHMILDDLSLASKYFSLAIWPTLAPSGLFGAAHLRGAMPEITDPPREFPLSSLSSMKNLAWSLQLLNRPSPSLVVYSGIETVFKAVAYDGGAGASTRMQELDGGGLSIYDFQIGKGVCDSASLARNAVSGGRGGEAINLAQVDDGNEVGRLGRELYLDLLRRSLTHYTIRNSHRGDYAAILGRERCLSENDVDGICLGDWDLYYSPSGLAGGNTCTSDPCPATGNNAAHLIQVQLIIEEVMRNGVEGDFIEAGVFRGGFIVYMRGVLAAHGDPPNRSVIAADSFQGIPPNSTLGTAMDTMLRDEVNFSDLNQQEELTNDWSQRYAAGKEVLRDNLRRFGLLDERLKIVEGYFNESLTDSKEIKKLSVIRLDSDAYESITDSLEGLYSKLSVGGYVIIDDMHLPAVHLAVSHFRSKYNVTEPVLPVPNDYVYGCGAGEIISGSELTSGEERFRWKFLGTSFLPWVGYWRKEESEVVQ